MIPFDMIDDIDLEPEPTIYPKQFDMITDTIAVGSLYSSYDSFQLIVNMAYRYDGDGFGKHMITHSIENGKKIIRVGIHDTPSEPLDIILPILIPMLEIYIQEHPTHRILIHCQAGMSRSASVAISLLSRLYSISFDKAFKLVQQKRSIVQPNQGFMKMLETYIG